DALLCHMIADGIRDLLVAGLAYHPASRHGHLFDTFLGDHVTSGDRHLFADGVGDLLADREGNLAANDLGLVDGAADVFDHGLGAADGSLAPGARALVKAAVDADRLARNVDALDDLLIAGTGDGLDDGPGDADRFADFTAAGLGHGPIAGLG